MKNPLIFRGTATAMPIPLQGDKRQGISFPTAAAPVVADKTKAVGNYMSKPQVGAGAPGAPSGALKRGRAVKRLKAKVAKVLKARKPRSAGTGKLLDLKAASVSWRKAGKPGRWLDWVKAHG